MMKTVTASITIACSGLAAYAGYQYDPVIFALATLLALGGLLATWSLVRGEA